MVFENVTLFELHLEKSRFSASRGGEAESEDETSYEAETEEESGGGGIGRTLGVLLVLVVAGLAFRRYRSGGDGGEDLGTDQAEDVSIEQTADQ
jgi:hypothetical protein